jgi:hypothetical protein
VNDSASDDRFAREAARVNLRKMLEGKRRGDRITAAEVVEATGFEQWRSFGAVIHTWARQNKLPLFPVRNDGWRLGLAAEHVDAAESKRRSARRREIHGLDLLVHAPRSELNDSEARRVEFLAPRAAMRVERAQIDDRDIKSEFKLTERVPLRMLKGEE